VQIVGELDLIETRYLLDALQFLPLHLSSYLIDSEKFLKFEKFSIRLDKSFVLETQLHTLKHQVERG
jgi:hypothetical protein